MFNFNKKIKYTLIMVFFNFMLILLYKNNIFAIDFNENNIVKLNDIYAKKIQEGKITLENNSIDSLLYKKDLLLPNEDSDGDGILNKDEIILYKKNGRIYLTYKTHPLLEDTDGDGIPDGRDNEPLKWNINSRDMVLFMELSYRDDDYIKKVLDNKVVLNELYKNRKEYLMMQNELSNFWTIKETYHHSNGFDAVLFETKNKIPNINTEKVQVLAIRGTSSGNDFDDDLLLFGGNYPGQAYSAVDVINKLNGKVNNLYITGHSLGGYLSQLAFVEAHEKGYSWIRKSYTFNAPKIKGSVFYPSLRRIAKKGNDLTSDGKSIHYKVDNDSVIRPVGNFDHAISIGRSDQGHSSRSYFEERLNLNTDFNLWKRKGMDQTGYKQPNIDSLNYDTIIKDSDIFEASAIPLTINQGTKLPRLTKNNINTDLNSDDFIFPTNVEYIDITHENSINTNTPGKYLGYLKILFKDNSEKIVEIPITVRSNLFNDIDKKINALIENSNSYKDKITKMLEDKLFNSKEKTVILDKYNVLNAEKETISTLISSNKNELTPEEIEILNAKLNNITFLEVPEVNDENNNNILDSEDLKKANDALSQVIYTKTNYDNAFKKANNNGTINNDELIDLTKLKDLFESAKNNALPLVANVPMSKVTQLENIKIMMENITLPEVNDENNNNILDSKDLQNAKDALSQVISAKTNYDNALKKANDNGIINNDELIDLIKLKDLFESAKNNALPLVANVPMSKVTQLENIKIMMENITLPEVNDENNNNILDSEDLQNAKDALSQVISTKTNYDNALKKANNNGTINNDELIDLTKLKDLFESAKNIALPLVANVPMSKVTQLENIKIMMENITLPEVNDENDNNILDSEDLQNAIDALNSALVKKEQFEKFLNDNINNLNQDNIDKLIDLKSEYDKLKEFALNLIKNFVVDKYKEQISSEQLTDINVPIKNFTYPNTGSIGSYIFYIVGIGIMLLSITKNYKILSNNKN